MSVLARLRELLDAPRFCPDDGQPISVRTYERFDPRTGERSDVWWWSCPDVRLDIDGPSGTWSQNGVIAVHVHGFGRPRWHVP